MSVIFHVSAFIDGEWRRYSVRDENELMSDVRTYQANKIPYSIVREELP